MQDSQRVLNADETRALVDSARLYLMWPEAEAEKRGLMLRQAQTIDGGHNAKQQLEEALRALCLEPSLTTANTSQFVTARNAAELLPLHPPAMPLAPLGNAACIPQHAPAALLPNPPMAPVLPIRSAGFLPAATHLQPSVTVPQFSSPPPAPSIAVPPPFSMPTSHNLEQ